MARQLGEDLHRKYSCGDVRTELLIECILAEHWRQRQCLALESVSFGSSGFSAHGSMPNLTRYRVASLNFMMKNLELLEDSLASTSQTEEEDEAAGEAETPESETATLAPVPTSGSTNSMRESVGVVFQGDFFNVPLKTNNLVALFRKTLLRSDGDIVDGPDGHQELLLRPLLYATRL